MVQNGAIQPRKRSLLRRLWPGAWRSKNRRVRLTSPIPSSTRVPSTAKTAVPSRPRRRRDLRWLARFAVLLATAFVIAFGSWGIHRWLTRSAHFAVKAVQVSPTRHVTADAIRARAGIEAGENLFAVDLSSVAREVRMDPWVARAELRRELPATLAIDVVEREPACVVALGPLYLAEASGEVFKRADVDEAAMLPVVTGVPRDGYIDDREASQALIRDALLVLAAWRDAPQPRPAIGEVHIDPALGATLYTMKDGVGVRVGRGDMSSLRERFARFDVVWKSLAEHHEQPRMILVDQRSRPDRVTVTLASR